MNRDDLITVCKTPEGVLMYLGRDFDQGKAMDLAEEHPDTIYFFLVMDPTTDIWQDFWED